MNRKEFLRISGGISAGIMAAGTFPLATGCAEPARADAPFGLQLYSLRDVLPGDPQGVLRQVTGFGYHQIESYEGPMGMFWGMGPAGFREYMDELGMELIASHCNIHENFEQKAADAASIDMKYLICPWIGAQESMDAYREQADLFNRCGEICRREGLRFAYHNHAYTFEPVDGIFPQDVLMENTDPDLVDYELDIYWVVAAGADPAEWLRKYPDRFTLSHVKDRKADASPSETDATVTLGTGMIDYGPLLRVARENGMEYFIVEQEQYEGTTPLDSAKDNALYMKSLKF
jgi:sugar phosphate isomerase/epimerase